MKTVSLILLNILVCISLFSQPDQLKWTSPQYDENEYVGFIKIVPTTYWRYLVDSANIIVYDGPYSSNQKYVLQILPTDRGNSKPYFKVIDDITGDGMKDLMMGGGQYKRTINGVDGSTWYTFNSTGEYYYNELSVFDIDGDGKNEFICSMYINSAKKSEVKVYATNGVATAVLYQKNDLPNSFELIQNYPNPFNPTTRIKFEFPNNDNATLQIFDINGRIIRDYNLQKNTNQIDWDGRDRSGTLVSSGVYFYSLKGNHFDQTKKMILLK